MHAVLMRCKNRSRNWNDENSFERNEKFRMLDCRCLQRRAYYILNNLTRFHWKQNSVWYGFKKWCWSVSNPNKYYV